MSLGVLKTTLNKRFYNLKRVKRKGMHAEIELGFDESRILSAEDMMRLKAAKLADVEFAEAVLACGGPTAAPTESSRTVKDVQVVIVEGDEAARIVLRKGLRSQPGLEVASEATNGETRPGAVGFDCGGCGDRLRPAPRYPSSVTLGRGKELPGLKPLNEWAVQLIHVLNQPLKPCG
jgi:hypothetical protein